MPASSQELGVVEDVAGIGDRCVAMMLVGGQYLFGRFGRQAKKNGRRTGKPTQSRDRYAEAASGNREGSGATTPPITLKNGLNNSPGFGLGKE